MDRKNALRAIPMVGFDVSTLGLSYTPINPLGITEACSIIRIVNASKSALFLSLDGSVDHDYIPSHSSLTFSIQNNKGPASYVAQLAKGTVISISGAASVGFIYVCGYY
jgi:hypothetical protein